MVKSNGWAIDYDKSNLTVDTSNTKNERELEFQKICINKFL